MTEKIIELKEDVSGSALYSPDLAPVPINQRSWGVWDLTAIWVGMAVCIPTYILASYMIANGLAWYEALAIIGLANLVVSLPMILNGHAGVKYGIPFPVLCRASFGTAGVHIPALIRGLVACGWFGIQTWIGGMAIYAIFLVFTGQEMTSSLSAGKFVCFGLFWLLNLFFIWKGTESIRWLEKLSAPLLLLIGVFLIWWGASTAGGFGIVLQQGSQLAVNTATLRATPGNAIFLELSPLKDKQGQTKAHEYQFTVPQKDGSLWESQWLPLDAAFPQINISDLANLSNFNPETGPVKVRFRAPDGNKPGGYAVSSDVVAKVPATSGSSKVRIWLIWLTAMVGFWATMAISIADITRYARTQRDQIAGQLLGLPATMVLYSFVGIFVTCAALINFSDILVGEDAPWDPVRLISRFNHPAVVVVAQLFMLIATLSTNIAANVIAPSNAFANLFPRLISFRSGGVITGLIGILLMPWWLLDRISGLLLFVSAVLGPVLGILVSDYFLVRKMKLSLPDLFREHGCYRYKSGFNPAGITAFAIGVLVAYIGLFIPGLRLLYDISWFSGSLAAILTYPVLYRLMNKTETA